MSNAGPFLYYFIGSLHKESQAVMDELKAKGEFCVPTTLHEEIDQGQKQVGKVIVIFSDIKFMLEFLKGLNTADRTLKLILIIDQNGAYKPNVMKMLRDSNVTLRMPKDRAEIHNDIKKFIQGQEDAAEEIQFSANTKE